MDCLRCGTCCTAPDITALGKALGVECTHLDGYGVCRIYDQRPAVCRRYRPDDLCLHIAAPTLAERVRKYLELFGLEGQISEIAPQEGDEGVRLRHKSSTSTVRLPTLHTKNG
ncbi:MAG: YkgJ family cysteine cluster protein [Geobacter sp.]|nr:MAG: YkgJ family cysteine cluster protein [Geobacter sp.]